MVKLNSNPNEELKKKKNPEQAENKLPLRRKRMLR